MSENKAEKSSAVIRIAIAFAISAIALAIIITLCGHNALDAFYQMFYGAFIGKFNFGSTIENFILILIVGSAYSLTKRINYFNIGLEGCLYIGAMFTCAPGFLLPDMPPWIIIPLCLACGMAAGAIWSAIGGALKAFFNINEACVTIMLNYVAISLTDFLLNNTWSAHSAAPETPHVQANAMLPKLPLAPSRASVALFIAIAVFFFVWFVTFHTTFGFKLRHVADNPRFCEAVGIHSNLIVLGTVMLSGALGGLAGGCQILGVYGNFIQNFSLNSAFYGMLACLLVKNNLKLLPLSALFIAFTRTGGSGMEYYTGVPKSLIDTVVPILILFIAMDQMFDYKRFFRIFKRKPKTGSAVGSKQ
ncbi:MAG: ABC transporter permease [Lachnospiraceae bacterium]|nr:ABC transporter permease [Lachnospiraceae bacterium]MDD3797019.1 ABC transporter permease [Lachnospiraceae bacterium]